MKILQRTSLAKMMLISLLMAGTVAAVAPVMAYSSISWGVNVNNGYPGWHHRHWHRWYPCYGCYHHAHWHHYWRSGFYDSWGDWHHGHWVNRSW